MTFKSVVQSVAVAATIVCFAAEGRPADADPEGSKSHRIFLGAGQSALLFNGGSDGHFQESGIHTHARLGYSYRLARGFELGGDVTSFPYVLGDSYTLPAFHARGYASIGARDFVEIGFTGRAGAFVANSVSFVWVGYSLSVGPNARVWLADWLGLELSVDGIAASGGMTRSPPDANSYARDSAGLVAVAGALSLVFRL